MAKPWGRIGAWAAEVEREEEEGQSAAGSQLAGESKSFPSLKESAAAKPKKKKQVMTLSEFVTGGPPGGSRSSEPKGLTPEEMLRLPTGPRERSEGEEYGRLGGRFGSYGGLRTDDGGGRGGGRWDRRDHGDGSWGSGGGGRSYGGFAEERREVPPRVSEADLPSRADEVDNWSAMKKSLGPPPDSHRNLERYGSLGGGANSRADDVDNWNTGKSLARPGGSSGSGFRDRQTETERRRIVLNPPSREAVSEPSRSRPSPFGAARPREEILAEKGLDWKKLDSEMDSWRSSRPTSEHSSRPSSAHSSRPGSPLPQPQVVHKPKPKINPFGDAKPREVLLEERGKDWRKIDFELEHRAVDRPETMEEKTLKDEISQLKEKLSTDAHVQLNGECNQDSGGLQTLQDLVVKKERELELIIQELDDKVRFGQKGSDRPGSGASRTGVGYLERPSSQSGASEDSRSVEIAGRPHSRGNAPDAWTRNDNGGGFRGTKERGFSVNRDADRLRSKERW